MLHCVSIFLYSDTIDVRNHSLDQYNATESPVDMKRQLTNPNWLMCLKLVALVDQDLLQGKKYDDLTVDEVNFNHTFSWSFYVIDVFLV